ncbi:hypothetical protein QCA50_005035 [Cerrena zonata]|uniref:Uncharacterized protein n=1 Tax=Cerrena zonata TaxID=2478898 RepID=A0AAW0GQ41_9APHY
MFIQVFSSAPTVYLIMFKFLLAIPLGGEYLSPKAFIPHRLADYSLPDPLWRFDRQSSFNNSTSAGDPEDQPGCFRIAIFHQSPCFLHHPVNTNVPSIWSGGQSYDKNGRSLRTSYGVTDRWSEYRSLCQQMNQNLTKESTGGGY